MEYVIVGVMSNYYLIVLSNFMLQVYT